MGHDLMERATQALRGGDPHAALSLLEGRDDLLSSLLRGRCFEVLGRADEALLEYERAALLEPDSPQPHLRRAVALRERGRVEAAVAALEEALSLAPSETPALEELLFTWMQLGHDAKVQQILSAERVRAPHSAHVHRAEGAALRRMNRHRESIVPLSRACEIDSDDPSAWVDLASARFRAGQFSEAFDDYEHALPLVDDPARSRSIVLCQAMCRLEGGAPQQAVPLLQSAAESNPGELRIRLHLGSALEQAGRYQDAAACLDELAGQADNDAAAQGVAAEALYAKARLCFTHLGDHAAGLDAIDTLVAQAGAPGLAAGRRLAQELRAAGDDDAARVVADECDTVESLL